MADDEPTFCTKTHYVKTLMALAMRNWEIASYGMFAYTAILAALLRGLAPGIRARAFAGSGAGLVVTAASVLTPSNVFLHGWLLPPLLLLLAYWTSGLLFTAPMPRVEHGLLQIDRVLRVRAISSAAPRWIAELLELSYAAVYTLIPIALMLHLRFIASPNYDRFWTVILVTDYVCFAVLPWIQTRPPRALEPDDPWRSSLRAFNLRLLGAASIRVNTFPSGHAAEALAAALLVSNAPSAVVAWMLFNALAVSAGAVFGRYHYATDAIAGWLVALAVWVTLD
jgi:membrane-associated phospholipid phosphatase